MQKKDFEGVWRVDKRTHKGQEKDGSQLFVFGSFLLTKSHHHWQQWDYQVDPETDPCRLQFRNDTSPWNMNGIWRIDGDQMDLCMLTIISEESEDFPSEFSGAEDCEYKLLRLTRIRKSIEGLTSAAISELVNAEFGPPQPRRRVRKKRKPRRKGKGHFHRVMDYISENVGRGLPHGETIAGLRDHPPGYRRCYAMYFSDADIDNGGFSQLYLNRFGCLVMSAIEAYERVGAEAMAEIMRSSLAIHFQQSGIQFADDEFSDVPVGYLEEFTPFGSSFAELDRLYYPEADRLPGASDVDSIYPLGTIDFYYEKFPEDF